MRAEALETLAECGYVDDARFAVARAEQLAGRGYGDDWIRGDLERQGVPPEALEAALAALEPERDRAAGQAERLGAGTAKTLARRGFSPETVEPYLARLRDRVGEE